MASYYRLFVESFATISARMSRLTQKEVPLQCSKECELSFGKLKDCLTLTLVLALPVEGEGFTVFYDAFGVGLGCVLMPQGHVIAYL